MLIRDALYTDLSAIADCAERFFEYAHFEDNGLVLDRESFKAMVEPHIGSKTGVVLLLVDGLSVVGGICGFLSDWGYNKSVKVFKELFYWVDDEYRGSRKSLQLFSMYEKRAIESGANANIMISVHTHLQEKVNNLYHRKGYTYLEQAFIKAF